MAEQFIPERSGLEEVTWLELEEFLGSRQTSLEFFNSIDKTCTGISQRNFEQSITLVFGSLWKSFDRLQPKGSQHNIASKKSARKKEIKKFLLAVFEQRQEEAAEKEAVEKIATLSLSQSFDTPQRAGLPRPKTPRSSGLSTLHSVRSEPRASIGPRSLSSRRLASPGLRKDRKDSLVACSNDTSEQIIRMGNVLGQSIGGVLADRLIAEGNIRAGYLMDYYEEEDDALLAPPQTIRLTEHAHAQEGEREREPHHGIPAVVSKSSSEMEDAKVDSNLEAEDSKVDSNLEAEDAKVDSNLEAEDSKPKAKVVDPPEEVPAIEAYKLANNRYDIRKLLGDIMLEYPTMLEKKNDWINMLLSVPVYRDDDEIMFRHLSHRFPATTKLSMFGLKHLRDCDMEELQGLAKRLGLSESYDSLDAHELAWEIDEVLKPCWLEKTSGLQHCVSLHACLTMIFKLHKVHLSVEEVLSRFNNKEFELLEWLFERDYAKASDFDLEPETGPRQRFWKHVPCLKDFMNIKEFIGEQESMLKEKTDMLALYNERGPMKLIEELVAKFPSFYWPRPVFPADHKGMVYYTKHWPWVQVKLVKTISELGMPPYFIVAMHGENGEIIERQTIAKYLSVNDFGSILRMQFNEAAHLQQRG